MNKWETTYKCPEVLKYWRTRYNLDLSALTSYLFEEHIDDYLDYEEDRPIYLYKLEQLANLYGVCLEDFLDCKGEDICPIDLNKISGCDWGVVAGFKHLLLNYQKVDRLWKELQN